jgi:histidyl-tRNA synthetase
MSNQTKTVRVEKPRGTRDFLPDEMEKRRAVERTMRKIVESYGYREICTPTFEHLELFTLKSGEQIVEEIYAFKDKSGRNLALRPELTAPVMRVFVNDCAVMPRPLRFYYFANCFRYERPQKGRYREFWQFGVELIGSDKPESDAEVITLAYTILRELGLDFELHVGHVGILRNILKGIDAETSSKIFRLIDKNKIDELESFMLNSGLENVYDRVIAVIQAEDIDSLPDFAESDVEKLRRVCELLDVCGVDYSVNTRVVRGLDYYTGVVFEVYAENLGAQKQICGGGSYRLAHVFGGENVPSTGFAIGFDRVMEICSPEVQKPLKVAVVHANQLEESIKLATKLRKELRNVVVVTDVMGRSLKKQLSYFSEFDFAIIVGKREVERGYYTLKDMKSGKQEELELEELIEKLFEKTSAWQKEQKTN